MGEIMHIQHKLYQLAEICSPVSIPEVSVLAKTVADRIKAFTKMITPEHYEQLKTAATVLLTDLKTDKPVVIAMEMGLGKSTMIEEFLKLKLNTDNDFGAIVVKERIEDILALEANLNGKAKAVYSFYPDYCLKGYKEYQRAVCKNCQAECKIKKAIIEQKNYPVLLMSSERFRLEMLYGQHLKDFLKFYDEEGLEHRRNILIIDEKPPLAINRPITRYDIRKVYEVIQNIQPESELYNEAQHLIVYLKKLNALLNDLDYSSPFLPVFEPGFRLSDKFKRFFENAYLENDVEILEHIASLIRKGGVLRAEKVKIKLEAQAITIDYIEFAKLKGLKTIIFDGTAKYDVEYKDEQFAILELPDIRSYNNLTIYNCPINMSRTNVLSKRSSERFDFQELFGDLESINGKEVLVLTYEKLINTVKKGMENTKFCENNHVYLDHYNNIKGKNIYANCTVLLNIGINYKGHAYYIAKSISLGEDFSDINEGEDKIRMLNKKIMPIIESVICLLR